MLRYPVFRAALTAFMTSSPSFALYTPRPSHGIFTPLCKVVVLVRWLVMRFAPFLLDKGFHLSLYYRKLAGCKLCGCGTGGLLKIIISMGRNYRLFGCLSCR